MGILRLASVRDFLGDTPEDDASTRGDTVGTYSVIDKANELRYTLGPVYSPGVIDSQGEFTDEDELRKMVWQYFGSADKSLKKQHGPETIGQVVEIMQWPFEQELSLSVAGAVRKMKLPAGTVYAGVQWNPEAWPLVKSGKITGYSMGGKAVRIRDAADDKDLLKFEI